MRWCPAEPSKDLPSGYIFPRGLLSVGQKVRREGADDLANRSPGIIDGISNKRFTELLNIILFSVCSEFLRNSQSLAVSVLKNPCCNHLKYLPQMYTLIVHTFSINVAADAVKSRQEKPSKKNDRYPVQRCLSFLHFPLFCSNHTKQRSNGHFSSFPLHTAFITSGQRAMQYSTRMKV